MYNPQLETFLRVADAGSFNKAASERFITPTAVIKQINLLEESLGVKLFDRTHRGLVLTDAGKSMYQDAKYIIQYCKDSVARAKSTVKTEEVIRIGTSPITPSSVLMELWPKVRKQYPNMKFQLVPFENTPENAREILKNLGQNIDVVAGIFDETLLEVRQCAGIELRKEPICCAVSLEHPLAEKKILTLQDLEGENLLLMHRGWSHHVDELRDDLKENYSLIHIVDFDFYNMEIFNRCENSNDILMAFSGWSNVHPLLKIIPVEWDYKIPYGLLHSHQPSEEVQKFLDAIRSITK
ncbi:MAG: LysR family transcriptional regulator [Clostridium sp.]